MAVFVVDASIAATWCFKEEATDYTNGILDAISELSEALAPRLWAYEIRNVVLMGLRRNASRKRMPMSFWIHSPTCASV